MFFALREWNSLVQPGFKPKTFWILITLTTKPLVAEDKLHKQHCLKHGTVVTCFLCHTQWFACPPPTSSNCNTSPNHYTTSNFERPCTQFRLMCIAHANQWAWHKGACEPVGVPQETHDHNYFRTRIVVNKMHPWMEASRTSPLPIIFLFHRLWGGLYQIATGS